MAKNAATRKLHEDSLVRRAELLDLIRGNPARKQLPLSVRAACDKIRINRRTVIDWCEKDPAFARAYEDAKEDGLDVLEDEAVRRGVEGVTRPIYQGGELVGHEQVYSDKMLEMVLAGRRSAVFGRQAQLNVQNNVVVAEPTDRDVAKALALLLAETKARQVESG